jgi:DNA-binding CsgD family transcriptional regulator/pimeloyl-ACP methyl ester carboxylesterase
MTREVRFCTSGDGTRIGYFTVGSGKPLVIVPSWYMSPAADSRRIIGRDFWEDVPRGHRAVTYDLRGIGASSGEVTDVALGRQVEDLLALVRQLDLKSFDLWCFMDQAATGVMFANEHPGLVNRLVFYNPWANVPSVVARGHISVWSTIIRADWAFASRCFAQLLYPKGPIEAQEASTKAIRETKTQDVALAYIEATNTFDVRAELGRVAVPSLVVAREGPGKTPLVPIDTVRRFAAGIPGSRFVAYDVAPAACPYYDHRQYTGVVAEFLSDNPKEMRVHPTLTDREVEVLRLVAQGKTNSEIADALVISRHTVDRHVTNVLTKTGSANRAEAVLYAARNGLVG